VPEVTCRASQDEETKEDKERNHTVENWIFAKTTNVVG